MDNPLQTLNETKAQWAEYYAAVLKEKYPEAAAWLKRAYGHPPDQSAAIQERLDRGYFNQEETPGALD